MRQLVLEHLGVVGRGEVAVVLARLGVGVDDPVDELLEAPLADVGADRAAEVLGGDDGGGVDRPEVGELDPALLEDRLAGLPVLLHDVAALPRDRVVGVLARGGEDALHLHALAGPRFVEDGAAAVGLGHVSPLVRGERGRGLVRRCYDEWCGACSVGALRPARVALGAQDGDLGLEVVGRREGPVDAGEPQVGDLVQRTKRAEDGEPDLVGGHLGPAGDSAARPRPGSRARRAGPR